METTYSGILLNFIWQNVILKFVRKIKNLVHAKNNYT